MGMLWGGCLFHTHNATDIFHIYSLFFEYHPFMMLQDFNSAQSAHVSKFMSLKQHNLILHFALFISRIPVSKPILQPL